MEVPKIEGLEKEIAALIISVCLWVVMKTIGIAISLFKYLREGDVKKMEKLSESLEKNTRATHELTTQLKGLEQRMVDTDTEALKLERSHVMLIATVRELAGTDKFFEIQKRIKDDQFIK